ncbi:MAG: hypothetical protein GYA21_11985 [Myxococcales bacterium]|nr:hypothetical protein [Myxococcales bacterium]
MRHIHELFLVVAFLAGCAGVVCFALLSWLRYWRWRRREKRSVKDGLTPRPGPSPVVRWTLTGLTLAGLGCLGWGFLFEPAYPRLERLVLAVPGLSAPLRLVQLSDLHLDGREERLARALALVEEAAPDLIALTGDYLNDEKDQPVLERLGERLVAIAGEGAVFAVGGNFDGAIGDGGSLDTLSRAGVQVLDGTGVVFTRRDAALQVFGMRHTFDYFDCDEWLPQLAAQVQPGVPAILLYHEPSLAESPGAEAFALQICGHTHGGQVRLPFIGALLTLARHGRRYQAGLYALAPGRHLYINRGLGLEPAPAPQVRFLCPPEVTLLELVPAAND